MNKHYNPSSIEKKWQKKWQENKVFAAVDFSNKPKRYILDMFPYPSGAGLHVGHPEGYTATDIISRYLKMRGFNVLHPMGWDAFGLPAENYAIKKGVPPWKSTSDNIRIFKRQIQSLGFSYDWDREINTSTPEYYKWTQWIFLELFNKGLAYKKKAKVNWCDDCQTVLANEQVVDGRCERCSNLVVQKDLEQWFFKITDYADELVDALDTIDWPESIKLIQRNWIGRSEGAEITFKINNPNHSVNSGQDFNINIFTTRPDTLYGATYMVLAPEHVLVEKLKDQIKNWQEVESYVQQTRAKTDLQRTDLNKEKSGVELRGVIAVNPANGEGVPVFIADYVLANYGTGAIMAVPAHDERDWEFARKYALPIRPVIEGGADHRQVYTGIGKLINSAEFDGMDSTVAKQKITKNVGGKIKTQYRLRDWLISRQRYWGTPIPIVYDPEGNPHPVKEEHLPLLLPKDVNFNPKGTSPLGSSTEYKLYAEKLYGKGWYFEIDTMDTFVCSSWYFFRFCDVINEQKIFDRKKVNYWLPVDMYVGGAEHAVLHLLYSRFLTKALRDMGYVKFNEPFTKLRNQGMILSEDGRKMSKSLGNVINPDEIIAEYGADTMRLYEMFLGSLEDTKTWSTKNILGVRRFLEKVWSVILEWENAGRPSETSNRLLRQFHKTFKKVTEDIENTKFNTAISAMMILVNMMTKERRFSENLLKKFLLIFSPFAPHMAEEIAEQLGTNEMLCTQAWPEWDESLTQDVLVEIGVQINGKFRGRISVAADAEEKEVLELAQQEKNIQKFLQEIEIKKVIYIRGRILNIVA